MRVPSGRQREWAALLVILLVGAYFRFTGIDWDAGQHLHPDERFLTMVEGAIRPGVATRVGRDGPVQYQPGGLLESYFDTQRSALNPNNVGYGFFVYGTFPLFAVRAIAGALNATDYGKVHLLGRQLSALADLGTVVLTYLIGRRLFNARVGLLGAALLAACVMHIQQSHFFVFDSFLVTLVTAAFYFCVDVAETGRWRSFALAGLFLGLAAATKLSMAIFGAVIGLAGVTWFWRQGVHERGVGALRTNWMNGTLYRFAVGGAIALAVAGVAFRVLQPYAFAGPSPLSLRINPEWWGNIKYQLDSQAGTVDLPPSIQWAGTEPLLFPWRHMVMWGMGPALGLAAWVGFGAAAVAWLRRGGWQRLLLVVWSALCFVYFASVLNKTMRYLLPVYPFLILLGAWGLVTLYDWARRERIGALNGRSALAPAIAQRAPMIAAALGGLVVVSSVLWAFAFTRVYTRPTSRVAATMWIYQNVPKGAVMANEHWDDPLPVPIPNYDHGAYAGPQLPLYDPDEPRKIDTLVQMLSRSDYINVTSNRLYGSIPRIPQRYPMSTEYYRRLFAGDLGFKLVHVEASYPSLGPLVINDDRAEEAFTVYDHPKVLIFQKQPDFSADRVREILSAVPLDNVVHVPPIQVGRPTLVQPDWLRRANETGGTWADQFSLDGPANALAPLTWYVTLQLLSLLVAPLLWRVLPLLPDRGYGIAKPLGLLAVAWVGWSLAGYRMLPWTRVTLLLSAAGLASVLVLALRVWGSEWVVWLRAHRRVVLTTEGVFLAAYALVLVFRTLNPDLWHPARGGEKPMEFSYLNAVVKTTYFPPYDPWYAGGYLNYYYFGYVLVAALIKLTGVMPAIGFNVAVAALYALLASGCFSFAFNLSRLGGNPRFGLAGALGAGGLGFLCVAFLGNLDGFAQLLERLTRVAPVGMRGAWPVLSGLWSLLVGVPSVLLSGRPLGEFDYWRSSRVIVTDNTINEFPFWTFLFADLHAHLISLPYQVAALGVLLHLAQSGLRRSEASRASDLDVVRDGRPWPWLWRLLTWRRVAEVALAAWLVGALNVINTWEFPTYLGLTAGAFFIAEWCAQRGLTLGGAVRALVSTASVALLAKPLFQPFWRWYLTFYSSVQPWMQGQSRLDQYLVIHGLLMFGVVTFVALAAAPAWRRSGWGRYLAARWRLLAGWDRFGELERTLNMRQRLPATGYLTLLSLTALLMLYFRLRGSWLLPVLAALLAAIAAAAWERRHSAPLLFAALLAGTGTALSMFVELYALSGDIGRMNTVFKFYLQLWVLWGLVTAVALAWGIERLWRAYSAERRPRVALALVPHYGGLVLDDPVAVGAGDGDAEGADGFTALSSGLAGASSTAPARHGVPSGAWAWAALGTLLILAALVYPLAATPARLADRFRPLPPSLDGMAYMADMSFTDGSSEIRANGQVSAEIRGASDYAAIRWLLQNVKGSPVILEAQIPEYRWGSRIAKYTGLPAVLGWRWHEAQQRGSYAPQVDQRQRDVQTMFNDSSTERVKPLLNRYGVRYIYVGDLERAYYSAAGLAKFDRMTDTLRPVYREAGVTIYEVVSNGS
jgi:YYY domain-containing protein